MIFKEAELDIDPEAGGKSSHATLRYPVPFLSIYLSSEVLLPVETRLTNSSFRPIRYTLSSYRSGSTMKLRYRAVSIRLRVL